MWSQVSLRLCDEYPPPPDIRLRDPGCHTGALNSPWRLRAPHHPQAPLPGFTEDMQRASVDAGVAAQMVALWRSSLLIIG